MNHGRTCTVALLCIALAGASAQAASLGSVTADNVAASGVAWIDGRLLAFAGGEMEVAGTPIDDWKLEAPHVYATWETVEANVYAFGTAARTDPEADAVSESRNNASIRVVDKHPGAYVFVAGHDATVAIKASNLDVAPVDAGELSEPGKDVDQQPPLAASWDHAMGIASAEASAVIEGDFAVAFWGITVTVEHEDGREQWVSGQHNHQAADPGGNVAVADETWLYLQVTDGRLKLPAQAIAMGSLIVTPEEASIAVNGSLHARGAEGTILGRAIDQQDVTVSGSLSAPEIEVANGRLAFQVVGEADGVILGDQRIAIAIAPEPQPDGVSWFWSFAAVPVLAAWVVRRQQPARRVARLRDSLGRGHFGSVIRRAPRWYGTKFDREARIATAVANLRLDAPERAMEAVEEGDVPLGMKCFLRAHALAIMGQLSEARALLREALETSPHMRYEAERNPALAPLLSMGSTEAYA